MLVGFQNVIWWSVWLVVCKFAIRSDTVFEGSRLIRGPLRCCARYGERTNECHWRVSGVQCPFSESRIDRVLSTDNGSGYCQGDTDILPALVLHNLQHSDANELWGCVRYIRWHHVMVDRRSVKAKAFRRYYSSKYRKSM